MKRSEIPDWLDKTVWKEFKNHRNRLRKPMTPYAEHKVMLRLDKARNEGFDPNSLLDEAIEKGWQTVYPKPHHLSRINDPNAAPPMYRGSVLNPDYQEWLANKEFLELNGTSDTSSGKKARDEAMRSIQRANFGDKTSDMAGEIEDSKRRLIN